MTTAERRCRICRWLLKPEKKTCGYCGTLYDDAQPPPPSPREEEQAAGSEPRCDTQSSAIEPPRRCPGVEGSDVGGAADQAGACSPKHGQSADRGTPRGKTIWVRDAYNLVSAEMRVNGDRIDVRYSVVGHNNVRGEPRVYGESLEMTPSQALDWFGQLSDRALRNELPPPIRQLRDELD